jgi:hypothetical protein
MRFSPWAISADLLTANISPLSIDIEILRNFDAYTTIAQFLNKCNLAHTDFQAAHLTQLH